MGECCLCCVWVGSDFVANRVVKCRGRDPPSVLLGVLPLTGFPCWVSASRETWCNKQPNDHLLLFVSESTKQHLFLRACLEFGVIDAFLMLFSWRLNIFTASWTFTISTSSAGQVGDSCLRALCNQKKTLHVKTQVRISFILQVRVSKLSP